MPIFFSNSLSLRDFVKDNDVVVWYGDHGIGTLSFIDTSSLHVVFLNRSDYENWDSSGRLVQITLF